MNELIEQKCAILPDEPGCYLMKDRQGTIIYVGKAKILKNRVRSYFKGAHDGKTLRLVQEIVDFEYIVTSSELEALILELHLIKKHDPKYNIMLKDDKTYPYIKITAEKDPRLIITRQVKKDKGKYFGPYPNSHAAHETKKLLDRLYPLRKCQKMPNRVCLYYHMGQCLAPCVKKIEENAYDTIIHEIVSFLNGGHTQVKKELVAKMHSSAETLEFERATEYRDQISHIEQVMEKQKMTMNDFTSRDIFGFHVDKGWMCVQVFFIRQGKLIERDVSLFPIFRDPEEEFITFLGQFYAKLEHIKPKEIYVPLSTDIDLASNLLEMKVFVPQRGMKKNLVELAEKNAKIALTEKFHLIERQEERTIGAVEQLGDSMGIATPMRIEAFDNSHIHGTDAVSAMVVFIDGRASKKDYRKYKTKTAAKHDDYGAMREVVRRRYTRVLKENLPLPDLIIIDGGKGQIEAAREIIEDELGLDIPIAGLAKDGKHQTSQLIYGDPLELIPMKRTSEGFYLLQRIQDEVHRFAITFHRQQRGKHTIASSLDGIEGIGPQRKKLLLKHFGSVKKIQAASKDELIAAGLPSKQADLVMNHYQKNVLSSE